MHARFGYEYWNASNYGCTLDGYTKFCSEEQLKFVPMYWNAGAPKYATKVAIPDKPKSAEIESYGQMYVS
jgi:hypothetical protein